VTESLGRQCNVPQHDPICSCPQLQLGHVRSRMMKSSIMVSSSSSQRSMNNAPGESGSCAASPNDVHHRCRWQGNGQILVLHGELQQELAQFPETGQTSCAPNAIVLSPYILAIAHAHAYRSIPIHGELHPRSPPNHAAGQRVRSISRFHWPPVPLVFECERAPNTLIAAGWHGALQPPPPTR